MQKRQDGQVHLPQGEMMRDPCRASGSADRICAVGIQSSVAVFILQRWHAFILFVEMTGPVKPQLWPKARVDDRDVPANVVDSANRLSRCVLDSFH